MGIARLAAAAPREDERNEVEYFRLPVRSVLNRVQDPRWGFEWTINPYRGCEFGCHYCYARYTHTYLELEPGDFERKIYLKEDAARILRGELRRERICGTHITLGAATDPYQPAEKTHGVTRAILETLLEFVRELPPGEAPQLSLTTKSNLILRDRELLAELARRTTLSVNLTIITLHQRLARRLEPRAPRPDLRLETVRQLNQAGVPTGIFAAPVLPGLTDASGDLEALCSAASSVGARWLMSNVAFLMSNSQKTFFPFLEREFPRLARRYRVWYRRNGYAPERYRKHISTLLRGLREKYALASQPPEAEPHGACSDVVPMPERNQLAMPFAS